MSLTISNLTSGSTGTGALTFDTASVAPVAGSLLLLSVETRKSAAPAIPSATGLGLTWSEVATFVKGVTHRVSLLSALTGPETPTPGVITIAVDADAISWIVDQAVGAGWYRNLVTASVSAQSVSASFAAFSDANNAGYACVASDGVRSIAPRAGWTELADVARAASGAELETQYFLGEDTAASGTQVAPDQNLGLIALEIGLDTSHRKTHAIDGPDHTGTVAGAPTTADYLVGTTQAGLSAEIVVGATPGGELGNTWASPTVDATHSGSTHSAATDTHIADTSAAHAASAVSFTPIGTIASTDVQAAIAEVASEAGGGGGGGAPTFLSIEKWGSS